MLKKNDTLELEISSITNLGFGVARHDGLVIFVAEAVTGDIAEVKIIKTAPAYAVGRVENFIKKSPLRTVDRCGSSTCTSCAYKSIIYDEELRIKREEIVGDFKKAGLHGVYVNDVTPSPKLHEYRNKAQYPISMGKDGEYIIGFYAPKSHRVREARTCPLAPDCFREIIDTAAGFFKKNSLTVYDEASENGLLRHIYLRRGEISGEVLLTIVINGDEIPNSDELVSLIKKRHPEIVGILININKRNTNVILGEKYKTLYGRDHIFDTLCGVELKISAPAFYQVNHDAAELLYTKAKELLEPQKSDTLLDLYCGAGSIGLSMADSVGELIGIEIIESAVECARENAKRAGITNAHFHIGDAKDTEKLLDNAESELGKKIEPTAIILDPPRGGCSGELLSYISRLTAERIVYISCNPATLARDAAILKELGYTCNEVTPFDLFPATGHVETVVLLSREKVVKGG